MVGYDPDLTVELPVYSSAVAGCLGGFVTRAVTHPLDVIKIRLQLHEWPIKKTAVSKYYSSLHACHTILREEKWHAFWKGHVPAQVLSVVYGVVQFSSFELLTRCVWKFLPSELTIEYRSLTHFVCGGLAGCCATLASQPFDTVRTRFIAQGEPKVYRTMYDALAQMIKREGLLAPYRGLSPTLLQVAPQTGLQFALYSSLSHLWNKAFPRKDTDIISIGGAGSLVAGSGAGLGAKIIVYPLDMIKKRLQVNGFQYGHPVVGGERKYSGLVVSVLTVARHEGLLGLYKGMGPSLLKAVISSGLYFASYEQLMNLFRKLWKNYHQTSLASLSTVSEKSSAEIKAASSKR